MYLPRRPFRVVASPPHGKSGPLLLVLLAPGSRLAAPISYCSGPSRVGTPATGS
jgi:hypothetical protein